MNPEAKKVIKSIIKSSKLSNINGTMSELLPTLRDLYPGNSSITKENIEKIKEEVMKEMAIKTRIKKSSANSTQKKSNTKPSSSSRRSTRKTITNDEKAMLYSLFMSNPATSVSDLMNGLDNNSSLKLSPSAVRDFIKEETGASLPLKKSKSPKQTQKKLVSQNKTQKKIPTSGNSAENNLNRLLRNHRNLFFNLSERSNMIKENGSDGNCLYYSVLNALVNPTQIIPQLSQYETRTGSIDTIHGYRLRAIAADYVRICELLYNIENSPDRTRKRVWVSEIKKLVSQLNIGFNNTQVNQLMQRVKYFADIGSHEALIESLYDEHGYKNLRNNVHSWAGQSTLMVLSILLQKHIIIFQLDVNLKVIIQKYDDAIPLLNGDINDSPNYIFLVRSPGRESHYRSLKKANRGSYIKLSNIVLDKMNDQPKIEYSFDEFNEFATRTTMNARNQNNSNNEWTVVRRSNVNAPEDNFTSSERKVEAVLEHMLSPQ